MKDLKEAAPSSNIATKQAEHDYQITSQMKTALQIN